MITMTDRDVLRQIPARFVQGWNRKNVEEVFADFADDAEFVNVFGARWSGKERIIKEHADRFRTMFASSALLIRDVTVREIPPNAAVIYALWSMKGHQSPDGHWAPVRNGIILFVAERRDEGWRIVASQNTDIIP